MTLMIWIAAAMGLVALFAKEMRGGVPQLEPVRRMTAREQNRRV